MIKWKGYSGAHNSREPEKNLNATDLVKEYYLRNPKKEGAAKWSKARETIVQTLTTTPIANPLVSNMPSRSSSVESLVARATERGYYSLPPSPSPMEVTLTPNQEVINVDALPQSPISVHSSPSPQPINPDLPFVEVTDPKLVLHPPRTIPAPPGLTRPSTPVIHRSTTEEARSAHAALTRLIHDPALDNYPINYERVTSPDLDDHPGHPFWLNEPWGNRYFKFLIPCEDSTKQEAKYVRLSQDQESLIGTMGKGQPHYGLPLFLLPQEGEDRDLTPTVTTELLQQLHKDSPLVPKIQEVLDDLQDVRLTAEVNRTRRLLRNQDALKSQVQAIYETAEPLERRLWDVNIQLSSARRRLQENQASVRISDHSTHLHPPSLDEPSFSPINPLPP